MIKTFNFLFVTMLGLGKVKFIPGTFGSFATVIILYICFHILNLDKDLINLKGKTVEKLGLIGKEKAIACEVIVSLDKHD